MWQVGIESAQKDSTRTAQLLVCMQSANIVVVFWDMDNVFCTNVWRIQESSRLLFVIGSRRKEKPFKYRHSSEPNTDPPWLRPLMPFWRCYLLADFFFERLLIFLAHCQCCRLVMVYSSLFCRLLKTDKFFPSSTGSRQRVQKIDDGERWVIFFLFFCYPTNSLGIIIEVLSCMFF